MAGELLLNVHASSLTCGGSKSDASATIVAARRMVLPSKVQFTSDKCASWRARTIWGLSKSANVQPACIVAHDKC